MGELGGVGLQELAARGRGEEQLAHFHARAARAGGGLEFAAAGVQPVRVRVGCGARGDGHVGHRRDRGQRLATKAHGGDRLQVMQAADLAGGVALERHGQLLHRNAAAVVFHHDGAHAASHQLDLDVAGAGVQRVVHQLAHDRGRPLDDLARGDLADQLVGQFADGTGRWQVARVGGQGGLHPLDYRRAVMRAPG